MKVAHRIRGHLDTRMFLRIVAMIVMAWFFPAETSMSEVLRQVASDWVLPGKTTWQKAGDGSYHYHSIDLQSNAETGENYERFVVKLLNESGVEEFSQLDINYKPEYETLIMHELVIERNGEKQNRLPDIKIETLRREEGMDESLYDGELTALFILEDIRPGDVLSYAFTTRGMNPVFKGHVHRFCRLGYSTPVDHVRRRLLWDPHERNIQWKIHGSEGKEVERHEVGEMHELLWEQHDVPRIPPEVDTPIWTFDYPWLEYSDYGNWSSFGEWALPLFTKKEELPDEVVALCEQIRSVSGTDAEKVVAALAWVQRNIRYLGSFFGAHTHEPYSLEEICRRRFGDCKDKSVLAVAILRELGYDAAPALVNTTSTHALESYLPGHSAFNHLVVHLKFEGRDYMLDPTETYRRGPLDEIHTPDYGFMFVVRPGARSLMRMPKQSLDSGETTVRDTYSVDEGYKGADLTVETVATGKEADMLRSYFAGTPKDEANENYVSFYADSFPGIKSVAPVEVNDDEQTNRIQIKERYRIPEFWKWSEEKQQWSVWVSADYLKSRLSFPEYDERTQPLAHTFPLRVHHTVNVNLPTDWKVKEDTFSIDDPAFQYRSSTKKKDKSIIMEFDYRSLSNVVNISDYEKHRTAMDGLKTNLSLQLWNFKQGAKSAEGNDTGEIDPNAVKSERSLGIMLIASGSVLGALIGIMLLIGIWFWNPSPREAQPLDPVGLGGWLIIPIIACICLPLACLYRFIEQTNNLNDIASTLAVEASLGGWHLYYFTGSFFNALTMALSILQLVLLFRRRTSFPWVFIGISVWILLANGLLVWIESGLVNIDKSTGSATGIGTEAVRLVIWGTYMIQSQRVKATFRRRRRLEPPSLPADDVRSATVVS